MGGGSTIAAAIAIGYQSIGIESDPEFFAMAKRAIPRLAALVPNGDTVAHPIRNGNIVPRSQQTLFG
jgi:site-specific DNA-methyltransferase (adenine-specific)